MSKYQTFTGRCKYSVTNTRRILFKSSIVSGSRNVRLSPGVCQALGKGDAIMGKTGTPETKISYIVGVVDLKCKESVT